MRKTTTFIAIAFAAATTSTALAQNDMDQGVDNMQQGADQMGQGADQMGDNTQNGFNDNGNNDYDYENANDVDRLDTNSNLFGPTQGDIQITVSGTGNNDNDFENGSGGIVLDGGYFVTDRLLAGIRQTLNYSALGNSSTYNGATSVYADYHFNVAQSLRPFVGLRLGYLYGNGTNESFIAGPEAGIKWYVRDQTFIYVRGAYDVVFEDADNAADSFDDGRFVYTLGVGFNF